MLNYLTERYRHILWNLTLRWSFNPATSPPPPSLLKTSMARCCRAGISQLSPSLLTWAAPGPSNPFSQKPHPFPPSASGTPRSPRKLLLPPSPMLLQNRADPKPSWSVCDENSLWRPRRCQRSELHWAALLGVSKAAVLWGWGGSGGLSISAGATEAGGLFHVSWSYEGGKGPQSVIVGSDGFFIT